jgi:hypothetical protein
MPSQSSRPSTIVSHEAERPLLVSFFVNFVHPSGTYFRFHNLAIGLTRLGHSVTVFAGDSDSRSRSRSEVRDGVPYEIIPETALIRFFTFHCEPIGWLRRFARSYPPCDVAHLFQPFPSAAAAWLRTRAKVRFYDWDDLWIGGLMAGPITNWRERWSRPVIRAMEHHYLPSRADAVTTISAFLADRARERGARNVSILNSGSWPTEEVDKTSVRTRLGLRPDALYTGFMGRNDNELPWCFEALGENLDRYSQLRLAVCGVPRSRLAGLPEKLRERVDYLGRLSPADAKAFASSLDLGLLPLEASTFNLSRLPQKFGDYLAARVPLLCSAVGECGRLMDLFPWAIAAGCSKDDWLRAFARTIERIAQGDVPTFDPTVFREHLSWDGLSRNLEGFYRTSLRRRAARECSQGFSTTAKSRSLIFR